MLRLTSPHVLACVPRAAAGAANAHAPSAFARCLRPGAAVHAGEAFLPNANHGQHHAQ
jgi:hypothetical protein